LREALSNRHCWLVRPKLLGWLW